MYLKPNTTLQGGKYKIVRHIASGGFGNTYEGELVLIHRRVAIKEFFVKDFCNRDENTARVTVATQSKVELIERLKEKFTKEAAHIWQFNHPNIVRVTDVFEENGTAYYVMDYIDGMSLQAMLKRDGAMSEAKALRYINQVADALQYVHGQKILHLDLKPGNIMVDKSGKAILIDFGAAKQYDEVTGENTSTLLGINTVGYAPAEQSYRGFVQFSASTDIYALGATLYKLFTDITPPDAQMLKDGEVELAPLPSNISASVRNAVKEAMRPLRKDRPQSVGEFLALLNNRPAAVVPEEEKTLVDEEVTVVNFEKTVVAEPPIPKFENRTFTVNGVSFTMVAVEGGTFKMGSDDSEAHADEKPIHDVTLSSYYIGETQVTQELWKAVVNENPSQCRGDKLPVECVSWDDCQNFIGKLNRITGQTFRLPTEAEWEYAARGGQRSRGYKYSGSDNIDEVAWYDGNSAVNIKKTRIKESWKFWTTEYETYDKKVRQIRTVASKSPNELGIYDMSGNIWEWCQDWYGNYSNVAQTNPNGPDTGTARVYRGGSWFDFAINCRSSKRFSSPSTIFSSFLGLRLAL